MLDIALNYLAHDLTPLPIPSGGKRPAIGAHWRKWQNRRPSEAEVRAMFAHQDGANIAVICGRSSDDLVILDCESHATFQETNQRLAGLGIATWTVQRPPNGSKHDGGGHFWLRTPEPVCTRTLDGLEILGQGRYALAPPSEHPQGGHYDFVWQPADIFRLPALDALPWLTLEPAKPTPTVPRLAWRLLKADPATLARYPSRSEAEAALCASLARAGFAFDDALRRLLAHRGPGKFADLHAEDPANGVRYLRLTWANAERWIADNNSLASSMARQCRAWAVARAWEGRGGPSERAVYLAHCDIVERCGRTPHHASARTLGELAGMGWYAAAHANRRLMAAELLELVDSHTPTLAARYRLFAQEHTLHHRGVIECVGLRETSHDAFHYHALGKTGQLILEVLLRADGETVHHPEIAAATGIHPGTIRRKLSEMARLGLVASPRRGWWQGLGVDAETLDLVASELGTSGAGARRKHWHEVERQVNRLQLLSTEEVTQ